MRIHRYGTVDSTQHVARALAEGGAPHGTVVLAEAQTAGRGRLDRRWDSAPGENLLVSLVLRPLGPPRDAPLLTLGAAAGLALALDLRVKWPNDLVTPDGQKVGGILAEMEGPVVILGLGLNVNQTRFDGLPNAISLAMLRGPQDREAVLDTLIGAILGWSEHPARLDLWRERSHTLGKHVRIGEIEGVATGLTDDGGLIVGGEVVRVGEIGA